MEILPTSAPEMMDDPGCSIHALRENLRDLALMNRLLGAHAFVRRYLDRVLPVWRRRAGAAPDALSVLDVGTGGADVPAAIVEWARRRGVPVRIVGIDRHPTIVRIAASSAPSGRVSLVRADALALPFRDASFDVCVCNLALHHLDWDERVALLRSLHAVARVGFLVVDLLRSPSGYAGVWLLTRLFRNALTRHDGPLSVRRAMTWSEYLRCARDADVTGLHLARLPLFRVALSRTASSAP
jgi:SAM-dependent methyltransferase